MIDLLTDPFEFFNGLDRRPRWLGAFCVVVVLGMINVLLFAPLSERILLNQLAEGVISGTPDDVATWLKVSKYYGIAITPVFVLLKWSILAFVIFVASVLFGGETSFRKTLSVLANASIIMALDSLLSVSLIYLSGTENLRAPTDIRSTVLSLNNFLGNPYSPTLNVVFDNLSIFSIWFWCLLGVGVAATARLSKSSSALVVGLVWLVHTGFLVLMANLNRIFG
ncbi:MAG TPA: YIP1 family protein [Pyrinomonadaceae bacterium]|nr:YIP1 family protein [Pyrinomonadaceae bacterium]